MISTSKILRIVLVVTIANISSVCGFLGQRQHHHSSSSSSLTKVFSSTSAMVSPEEVKVGDSIPSITLKEGLGDFQNREVNIAELIAGKKAAIFGVPGAFTPG
jgi:hypothetical protein